MKLFAFVTAVALIAIGYFVGWATSLFAALFIFLCALFRKAFHDEQKRQDGLTQEQLDQEWRDNQW